MNKENREKQIIEDVYKILKQRAASLSKEKSRSLSNQLKNDSYFVFMMGTDLFAMNMNDIEEIHEINEVTPIPNTPEFVLGMTNLRGKIISVLDIKSFIKTKSVVSYDREKSAFFVIKTDKFTCSFIVSEIVEKREVPTADISSIGSESKKDNYVSQSFKMGRRNVGILNIKKLLNNEQFIIDK